MRVSLVMLAAALSAVPALPACPTALVAQQPGSAVPLRYTVTLQDAIAMAQRQGPAAQIARSQRDAARARDKAFNAGLLPQISLSGEAANLNHSINTVIQPDGSTEF